MASLALVSPVAPVSWPTREVLRPCDNDPVDPVETWSTRSVEPRHAADYWRAALNRVIPGLNFDPLDSGFEGRLRQRGLGVINLNVVAARAQRTWATTRMRRAATSPFGLIYVRKGTLRVHQCAHTAEIGPGECILLDGTEPSETIARCESETLNLALPGGWLRQWLVRPESAIGTAFTHAARPARPLLDFLDLLIDIDSAPPAQLDLVMSQLGGALAMAAGDGEVVGTNHATRLLNRLRTAMAVRFYDLDYGPQTAADEAGISRRYLVTLFASAGTTFSSELMRVRLERSSEMLGDARFASLSVMDVALRCGFSDASHFSKRYRARFGTSPANHRRTTKRQT